MHAPAVFVIEELCVLLCVTSLVKERRGARENEKRNERHEA